MIVVVCCWLSYVRCSFRSLQIAEIDAAVSVGIMQIPFELGLAIERPVGYFVLPITVVEIFRHIRETNVCALVVSIVSFAFLLTIKVRNGFRSWWEALWSLNRKRV